MNKINFFVYGSLREGFFNYDRYLAGKVAEIRPAKLENMKLYDMPYKGYPAIVHGEDEIVGEIMVVNDQDYASVIEAVDGLEGFYGEGHPENEYHKMIVEVEDLVKHTKEQCFVYFYNQHLDALFSAQAVYLADGDWKKHMLQYK